MQLNITNEFETLKSAIVCWGDYIVEYNDFKSTDPEFLKFHPFSWNKSLLLKQQEKFFATLQKYDIKLIFSKAMPHLSQQIFTRDTAFVVGNKLYFSKNRKFKARNGEIEELLKVLNPKSEQIVEISGEIEGGDVLVTSSNSAIIGQGSRTESRSIDQVAKHLNVERLFLGQQVMHLDTRLTLLPHDLCLINTQAFTKDQLNSLAKKYQFIEVSNEETKRLGTNVFLINSETVCVAKEHNRIARLLSKDFKVEVIDYSEPINLSGSFRCTTMPLERSDR